MAKKKAIVRRLAVIEALGTTDVIATDKTGTLTDNELTISKVAVISGGKVSTIAIKTSSQVEENVLKLFEKGVLCSNVTTKDAEELIGDPIDVAIVDKAKSFHEGIIIKTKPHRRLMEVPFDSEKKYMAVLVESPSHKKEIIAKGAAEKILSYCKMDNSLRTEIKKLSAQMSKEGLKVIALAVKEVDDKSFSTLSNLKFVGLFGLVDEPSSGIKDAIERTIEAGIRPIIITGDHPETARFVAEKIGLTISDQEIMTGADLEKLTPRELRGALKQVKIFARITPEDKINIVDKLEEAGYCVAVTGDGINDAPAIKRASVGIAMGIKGTDVSKESADIILSNDKYGTIISAIEYGRAVYDNIKNAVTFLLSGNFDEIFLIGFAFIFDLPMPLLTLQILWINMVTDSLPALALAFESPSPKVLREKPRSGEAKSMRGPIIYAIYLSFVGVTMGIILYLWGLGHSVEKARTLVFTYAVFQELVYVFSIRSPYRIWQNVKSFFANKFLIASIVLVSILQCIIFLRPFNKIFSIVKLSQDEIIVLAISIFISFIAAELIRWRVDKKKVL
jgi:Ca2+-transporting ATPase